jgi:hypothetical protein
MIPLLIKNELSAIDRGLFCEKISKIDGEWVQIKHKDDRTGLVRNVFKVRELNHQTLNRLRFEVDWKAMLMNPDPENLERYYAKIDREEKAEKELKRRGFIMDWRSSNRKKHKRMFEEYRQNLTPQEIKVVKRSNEKLEYLQPKQIKIYQGA